jgi:putative ABC transport system permease protein
MIRPRWRKVLADLWSNKVRSLLVISSIAIGLFAIGIISTIHTIISEDMQVGYAAVNPANIQVNISSFGDSLVDQVRNIPGVEDVEGVRALSMRYMSAAGTWNRISIQAIPDIDKMKINLLKKVEGAWPPTYLEIAVDLHHREEASAALGGNIEIELPSGKTRNVQLVGVMHDQTIGSSGSGGGFFLAPLQGYISMHTLGYLDQPADYNTLYVTVKTGKNDEAYIRSVARQITDEVENQGDVVLSTVVRRSNDHPNSVYTDAISGVLYLLGFLVVFLSGFLITNTLSALLKQQIRQIGVMKTIGARRFQIINIYMVLIFFYGILAFAIAVPLAGQVAYWLLNYLAWRINFDLQGFRWIPSTIIIQAVIALIVPQVAALVPIMHGSNIKTHEAINSSGSIKPQAEFTWFDRQILRIRGISRPLLISLRNTFRGKGRLALTLFTLILGGSIFIATFNVKEALMLYIANISKYFLADVSLSLDKSYPIQQVQSALDGFPGIKAVEGWAYARCEVLTNDNKAGESVDMLGVPPRSKLIVPILVSGRWLAPGDQNAIVLNERFMSVYPNLKLGDPFDLRVNGSKSTWVVVGFFQLAGNSTGFRAYSNYDYLAHLIGEPGQAAAYRIVAQRTDLNMAQQEQLGARIELFLRAKGYGVSDVTAGYYSTDSASAGLNTLTSFLVFMAVLIAAVGAIGLMGTMSMNVMDRTREIGIMRSIGASDRMVMNLVIVEGLLIGIISWVAGCLLAFPISNMLSDTISLSLFNAPAHFAYTSTGFLIWLGLVLFLSILASVLPARNAARLTIREVLAYE